MTELLSGTSVAALAIAAAAGIVLGLVFLAGLSWTVTRLVDAERPVLLLLASYFLRMAVTIGGFYAVMQGSAVRALACLAGFLVVRAVVRRRVREKGDAAHA